MKNLKLENRLYGFDHILFRYSLNESFGNYFDTLFEHSLHRSLKFLLGGLFYNSLYIPLYDLLRNSFIIKNE